MEGSPRAPRGHGWPYLVFPPIVLILLGACWVDSVLSSGGTIDSFLPRGLELVARIAEAGTAEAEPDPLPDGILEALDLGRAAESGGRLVQPLDGGDRVTFTIVPELQEEASGLLSEGGLLSGSILLVESQTGKILAMASEGEPLTSGGEEREEGEGLPTAFAAEAPAASVFKLVTATALVETAEMTGEEKVCYWGGGDKLEAVHLEDDADKDKSCATLKLALGMSLNCVFAKLADRNLDKPTLEATAEAMGFGEPLPIDYPTRPETSPIDVPEDRLEFARTAAGFWHVHMTPVHAAFIAQSIAQEGSMLHPLIVDHVDDAGGEETWKAQPRWLRRTMSKETAATLGAMMVTTTTKGTARKYFKDKQGKPFLPGITVAGKTGTLTRAKPYRAYTWFVGFAPADDPRVAIAVLAVNAPEWKVKAASLASSMLRAFFDWQEAAL